MDDNSSPLDLQAFKLMIRHLDEDELVMLNRLIVERTKRVRAENKAQSMAAFEVGDAVFFDHKDEGRIDATVLRLNKKTLSLVTIDGHRWNVAPELCQLGDSLTGDMFEQENSPSAANVTVLPTKAAQLTARGRWYGGAVEMPAYISEEGESYRPMVMIWIDADGLVASTDVCAPDSDLMQVGLDTLQQALHSPMTGKPQRPKYITVNDRDLAVFLASRVPGIHIEFGDTPILQDLVDNMGSMMPPGDDTDTYLSTGLRSGEVSLFFDAAADLYRSAPWQNVPHDETLLSLTIRSLDVVDAVVSVIGQMGESFGIVVYADIQQYCQFHVAGDRMRRGLDCDVPPHRALNFVDGVEVSTAMRKEIAEHGWQVVNTSSYPDIFTPDRGNVLRPLSSSDVALFEALSRALPTVLKNRSKLFQAWNGGNVFYQKITVDCVSDRVDVEIGAPYPFEEGYASKDSADTTMVELALLAHSADEPDFDVHNTLCDTLQSLFYDSREGEKYANDFSIVTPLLQLAFSYQSATIATLQAAALEEVVFDIIPRKVMVDPAMAKPIIEECRLFYRFLKRQYALAQADNCLEILGGNAVSRLKAALSDDSGFGMGKAALAGGMLPDFDNGFMPPGLTFDPEEIEAMAAMRRTPGKPVDPKTKKKKRKDAKKARKKNR